MSSPTATGDSTRRDFLKKLSAAAIGTQFLGLVTQQARGGQLPSQMNLMLILTDQERMPMWFPAGWEAANLPNTTRLKNNGLTFTHAFCATAMCTPSRNSLFTGLFPAQNHADTTLTEDFQQSLTEPQLDASLPNLATCLKEAGYDVIYKGKWHMSKRVELEDGAYIEDDISRYGFDQWDAPDAGGDAKPSNFGGGTANNDGRFMTDALAFLEDRVQSPTGRPFCLIVSLINPHDVLGYPGSNVSPPTYIAGGYDDTWLAPTTPPIPRPPTVDENLNTNYKPIAQAGFQLIMAAGLGPVNTPQLQLNYLNFYGNLMKKVDGQIGQLLAVFDDAGAQGTTALNNTLIIRSSDHGEMGMCHGALRQKAFVCYEEVLRVPMIWSNPTLYLTPQTTDAFVSHPDLLPTLCALTGVPNWQSKGFAGVDYSSIVLDPAAPAVQDYVLFTFDDIQAGQDEATALYPNGASAPAPNRIRMIRTADFKYARYFGVDGNGNSVPDEQEFYDLRPTGGDYSALFNRPLEMNNLSIWAQSSRAENDVPPLALTGTQETARTALMNQLAILETTRLAVRPYSPSVPPGNQDFQILRWTDPTLGPQAMVQLTFDSCINTNYQLQKSTDLVEWDDVVNSFDPTGDPVNIGSFSGTNGPMLMSDTFTGAKAFYRIQWSAAS